MRTRERIDPSQLDIKDNVVAINRVTKVVKGGKNLSFSALVVVGDGANAPVVEEPAAVEDHSRDALADRSLGDGGADGRGALDVAAAGALGERALQRRIDARGGRERLAAQIVDHLRVDMRHAAEHAQPRPLGRARNPLPLPELNPAPPVLPRFDLHDRYFAPVLPAFFFSTSPVYRTPFCL